MHLRSERVHYPKPEAVIFLMTREEDLVGVGRVALTPRNLAHIHNENPDLTISLTSSSSFPLPT